MFVELHILQNFAPSNLNRDDTGAPKDCEFGGYRRARVSSQAWKRAIRREAGFAQFLEARGGVRTRQIIPEIACRLTDVRPVPEALLRTVAEVFKEAGLDYQHEKDGKWTTKILLFVDRPALDELAECFRRYWGDVEGKKKPPTALIQELGQTLAQNATAPDIALFGRMVEIPENKPLGKLQLGVDGACQVAHAISTHRVSTEFDFYTAVDDLLPEDERGAGMMGTVEFTSACFYRYLNVDVRQLTSNLGGDAELARTAVGAFVQAAVTAVPSGKQHSMAAQNPPSLVFAVVRSAGLCSLTNAFVRPVHPDRDGDLMANSVRVLDRYWGSLAEMYGTGGVVEHAVCTLEPEALDRLAPARVPTVAELLRRVDAAIARFQGGGTTV